MAAALKRALGMPLFERRERHGPMLEHLLVHNIEHWAESYLAALAETRQRPSLMSDLRIPQPVEVADQSARNARRA